MPAITIRLDKETPQENACQGGQRLFVCSVRRRHLASSPGSASRLRLQPDRLAADLREKRFIDKLKPTQAIDISGINPEWIGGQSARAALAEPAPWLIRELEIYLTDFRASQ